MIAGTSCKLALAGEDLQMLKQYYVGAKATNKNSSHENVFSLVVSVNGVYAILIDNIGVFNSLVSIRSPKTGRKKLVYDLLAAYQKSNNRIPSDFEKAFLKVVKNLTNGRMGIRLMKLDNLQLKFNEVSLTQNNEIVITPCN